MIKYPMTPFDHQLLDKDALSIDRLELALRASNEGIWDWWVGETEIYYSPRVLEFLQCKEGEAPNLFIAPHDWIHPEDRIAFERIVQLALSSQGPEILAIDTRVKAFDGSWRWFRIRGTVVRTEQGVTQRIAGSIIDISLRKNTEAKLEDERHLLKQLIDHIPLQVYFKDLRSRFIMANQGMAEWMGLKSGDCLIGKHDRDFFDEAHWLPAEHDERKIMESGEAIANQLERETWRQGEETWVLTSKFPWRDRHGHIKGTFGVSSDVTKLVLAQREAASLAKILKNKNEIYEEELILAREIQQALTHQVFPQTQSPYGEISLISRYEPASDLAGDFFQVFSPSPDCWGILICDVMGHGVRSALVVAMMRGLIEKQSLQLSNPAEYLTSLNESLVAILERAHVSMFATAFLAIIDLKNQRMDYACAGHPGPLVRGPEGVRQLAMQKGQKGPGLGLIRGAHYQCSTEQLTDIQQMYLFTDGVLEVENSQGELFYEKQLESVVSQFAEKSVEETIQGIFESVLAFSKSGQFEDDVCMIGVDIQLKPREES